MNKYLYILLVLFIAVPGFAQDPVYPPAPATLQHVTAAEYFIDQDPGIGSGTPITLTPGTDISNLSPAINVAGLSNGVHWLFVRTRNMAGVWSIASFRQFLYDADLVYVAPPAVVQNIVAAEYFIDTDPGFGSGTAIGVTPGLNLGNVDVTVNTNGLSNGTHRLYVRTKNQEGHWSLANVRDFIVDFDFNYPASPVAAQNMVAAEYFIDTDPGFGSGTTIAITPGLDINNQSVTVNTNGLSNGTHRIYIRTRNQEGRWSLANVKDFIVDADPAYPISPVAAQNMLAAEYFVDTDPGFGNGTAIAITPGIDIANQSVAVNTTGLPIGTHRVYIRTRNQEGRWSLANVKDFIVDSDIAYPAAPVAAQNMLAAEYFIDTDPGLGNGTAIPVTPGVDINNIPVAVNTNGLNSGDHILYVRTRNQEGRWSLTSNSTFNVGIVAVGPDTLAFGNVPLNMTIVKKLVITNAGSTSQTVTGVTTTAPFTTDFTGTITIAGHSTDTIEVSFTPTATQVYDQTLTVQTSAGNFNIVLKGTGITLLSTWVINPATGHDYGMVATGSSNNFNFTIRNTGNVPVVLSNVQISNTAFTPVFTPGTSIPAGGSILLPVNFTPLAITSYTGQLKITSSTTGVDSVTTTVWGNGFTPGTPPVLTFAGVTPYSGVRGVSPMAGPPGTYTYKVIYTSANNVAPQTGYPKIGIDRNGDHDFGDAGESEYTMSKEGNSTDYAAGVTYTYTVLHPDVSSTLGYRFIANDNLGNAATTVNAGYTSGPVITYDQVDLRIFANDITFSKNNPLVNEPFTLTANITNSSALAAANVPVRFYRDNILLDSAVIPAVNAFSSTSITKVFSFAADGFYPIKVWIDSSNTLNDANILNNYAIRPVIVGNVVLPGGITVNTTASLQACPQKLLITGSAQYYGVATPTMVAGAEVTINTGTQVFTTTTNANGVYTFLLDNPPCGGAFTYTVRVTDFTFISNIATGNINITCPGPNDCVVQPQPGMVMSSQFSNAPCGKTVGTTGRVEMTVTYRSRNLANMWCLWDQILKDTIKIYHNGNLIQTLWSVDGTTSPGAVKVIPVNVTLNTTGPNVIEARHSYIYNEFFENASPFYHGIMIPMSGTGSVTMLAESTNPDLTIKRYEQLTYTSFRVAVGNIKCGTAGSHIVRIYDSLPGGNYVLIQSDTVASIAANAERLITFSDSTLAFGKHFIRVVVDAAHTVDEVSEDNNIFETSFTVPQPDLTVTMIEPLATGLAPGVPVRFRTTVKNTGMPASAFKVVFRVNGVQVGNKITVGYLGEKQMVTFVSDPFVVTTFDRDCPVDIQVVADIDGDINESSEGNNSKTIKLGADIAPYMVGGEKGSAANPVVVRINTVHTFNPLIRNIGNRNIMGVTVRFSLNGEWIGADSIVNILAGEQYPAMASFTRSFATPGNYVVTVTADTANSICEIGEGNNQGSFHIRVVDANPDLEVLSQYISPSALNPNPGESITLVGTVKNIGFKVSQPNVMRFLVDDVQIGNDVPFNALAPGKDTTIAATAAYSSLITGTKIMKIVVDQANTQVEERDDNNEATRALIVGNAPDLARSHAGAISFNPQGFNTGDSVTIFYSIKNNGSVPATAWVRFLVFDAGDALTAIDSVPVSLPSGASMLVGKRMLFSVDQGMVVAEIVNCSPMEFDLLNNNDTLAFSTVSPLKANTVVNGDLDMEQGLPGELPGWIGGKLILGDYDLTINGQIKNFDTAHFVITNGTGRLKFVNNHAENVFPVGTSVYNTSFLKINNTGTPDNFTVRVLPYVLKSGTGGDTIRTGNVNRTWLINEDTPGGSNATVEFTWNAGDELPGFDRLFCKTAHFTNGWQFGSAGAAATDAIGRYVKSQSGYTSFSPFTVTSGGSTPLPLRLLQFTASKQASQALLNWQTTEEVNTSHFVIEHSLDGQQFTAIGRVTANNRPGTNNYRFTHALTEPMHYYRLKMVDLDGNFTYSDVKVIRSTTGMVLQVFPNPARQSITVRGADPNGILQVITADGRLMKQYVTKGGDMHIDVSALPAGMYIIWYKNHDRQQQQLIMKE